jgi:hypothetical protein
LGFFEDFYSHNILDLQLFRPEHHWRDTSCRNSHLVHQNWYRINLTSPHLGCSNKNIWWLNRKMYKISIQHVQVLQIHCSKHPTCLGTDTCLRWLFVFIYMCIFVNRSSIYINESKYLMMLNQHSKNSLK